MSLLGDKLLVIRKKKGMNQADFGKLFGVSRPTYALIESNEKGVDRELLYKISKALRIPESELQNEKEYEEHTSVREDKTLYLKPEHGLNKRIPFYDVITVGGNAMLADQSPINEPSEFVEPGTFFKAATGALRVYGHSMFPKYPSGCIVGFKPADIELIIWGEDYVIELSDRRIVKRLERGEDKQSARAISYNVNKDSKYIYDPIDIPLSKIKRLFMVLGKIELESSI